ncbi:MAG: hypothetical protein EBZ47_06645 [Chlamydiae bacterium]|nr:hypothetical protein [Chlamydiota bacterium]
MNIKLIDNKVSCDSALNITFNEVDEKVKTTSLAILGSMSMVAGICFAAIGSLAFICPGFNYLSIPLFMGAGVCFYYASKRKNHLPFCDQKLLREKAQCMGFFEIIKNFGIKNCLDYRFLSFDECKTKLYQEITTSNFTQFKKNVNQGCLKELLDCKLITQNQYRSLKSSYQSQSIAFQLYTLDTLRIQEEDPVMTDRAYRIYDEHMQRYNENFRKCFLS